MSNKKYISITLFFITLFLSILYLKNNKTHNKTEKEAYKQEPDYQINKSITFIYNKNGNLIYKFTSKKINSFSEKKIIWFFEPILIIYNKLGEPKWKIKGLKAKLIHINIIYFYDKIEVNNLTEKPFIQKILTKNAIFNLITQEILSKNKSIIIGKNLNSIGTEMKINFHTETVELSKNVKTYYKLKAIK